MTLRTNMLCMIDEARFINKQCWDTKNNDTQNGGIQLIDKKCWAK